MDFYKSSLYIYKLDFPMRGKYLSTIENYTKRLSKDFSYINKEFSKLLKKSKKEEMEEEEKKKYLLMLKLIEEKRQKKIQSEINRQKRIEMNKKITKSISNNNMLLNLMSKSKIFIKYLNYQKQSRNNNNLEKNNSTLKTYRSGGSYTFMTELTKNNIPLTKRKNIKNIIKNTKHKVPRFNFDSHLTLKQKIISKKNITTRKKNFSMNDLIRPKTVKIPRLKKPKIKLLISNDNKIKPFFVK